MLWSLSTVDDCIGSVGRRWPSIYMCVMLYEYTRMNVLQYRVHVCIYIYVCVCLCTGTACTAHFPDYYFSSLDENYRRVGGGREREGLELS